MDLETLKYIETLLLDSQGKRLGIQVALGVVRSRIAELENRSPLTLAETTSLQVQNANLQAELDSANALIIQLGGPPDA